MEPERLILATYLAVLSLLAVYGLHRLVLLRRFRWGAGPTFEDQDGELPRVTVQLPLYNERTVAARLIRATGELDYPAERLEIQVLDDSTDGTRSIVDREVELLRERGLDARVLRRSGREGYKAGALDLGLRQATGQLVCVFDADFVPPADFLRRSVGGFQDERVGMVQARWGHANRDDNLFTRAQATLLDGHFVVEHKTRFDSGLFFNFNGTAGIWRRETISDAGGWSADTLTEDLDLSYRAQLAGWRFIYLADLVAPAELPPTIGAFKSQQHRWAKGSVQVLRKLGGRILGARQPVRVRLEALTHLTANIGYPAVLILALLMPLTMRIPLASLHLWHLAAFVACSLSVALFYETSQRAVGRPLGRRLVDTAAAVALGIGMCVSQTRAVLAGLGRRRGAFVRTPKSGDEPSAATYRASWSDVPGGELLLSLWCLVGIGWAVQGGRWGSLPFLFLFLWGFAWVGLLSLRQRQQERSWVEPVRQADREPASPA